MQKEKERQEEEKRANYTRQSRKYSPENCQRTIVAVIEFADVKITLMKHHAFDWAISKTEGGKCVITMMSRIAARREFNKLKKAFTNGKKKA